MGPGFESLIAYKKNGGPKDLLFFVRDQGSEPNPFFSSLRERGGLRPLSLAYSLRPNTLVRAY